MELSIIIPVYNAEKYLNRAIESVVLCHEKDYEVLLVDDGSTDGSGRIMEEWEKKDSRIRVIRKKNGGVSSARNRGISDASGKYLMFLDADDWLKQDWWKTLRNWMTGERDFVGFSYDTFYREDRTWEEPFPGEHVIERQDEIQKILFASPLLHVCWGKLFLREKILSEKILFSTDLAIGEDYYFVLQYMKTVKSPVLVNESILYYWQNPSGAMGKFDYEKRLQSMEALRNLCYTEATELQNESILEEMSVYYFRSLTKMMREIAATDERQRRKELICKVRKEAVYTDILEKTDRSRMTMSKKIEYSILLSGKDFLVNFYFRCKALAERLLYR